MVGQTTTITRRPRTPTFGQEVCKHYQKTRVPPLLSGLNPSHIPFFALAQQLESAKEKDTTAKEKELTFNKGKEGASVQENKEEMTTTVPGIHVHFHPHLLPFSSDPLQLLLSSTHMTLSAMTLNLDTPSAASMHQLAT